MLLQELEVPSILNIDENEKSEERIKKETHINFDDLMIYCENWHLNHSHTAVNVSIIVSDLIIDDLLNILWSVEDSPSLVGASINRPGNEVSSLVFATTFDVYCQVEAF